MYYKYPRTLHMCFSPGITSDDKVMSLQSMCNNFQGESVIITEKMDGESSSLYRDHLHARSIDSTHHSSREWLKRFHAEIAHDIPDGWRICGENMYAKHSISYDNLDSYFYGFSIWNEQNICLPYKETLEWFDLLGIKHAPIIVEEILVSEPEVWLRNLRSLAENEVRKGSEGIVMRNAASFSYENFKDNLVKYVRANHVQTDNHWMHQMVIPNQLKQEVGLKC